MVSIHIVPVVVSLIISKVLISFRFKRETCLAHRKPGSGKTLNRNEQRNKYPTLSYILDRVQHGLYTQ